MGMLKPWHIIVLVVVILLLFGARRLPDLARSVGQSLKIFKKEVKELTEDDKDDRDDRVDPAPQDRTTGTPGTTGTGTGPSNVPGGTTSPAPDDASPR
ncbi:Sec-independent protein translocase subunit TatA [Cellulosimicrobium cellulans]|uniref:Sec-independent protein translocase subunit TatA n=1 Tax=Cellulosimicrobium cellulans TaxID=1710 RepID=UPI00084930EC|nr:Sec-independent protein translocase subunit TatA [Cellulosimicrobium cellulans]